MKLDFSKLPKYIPTIRSEIRQEFGGFTALIFDDINNIHKAVPGFASMEDAIKHVNNYKRENDI